MLNTSNTNNAQVAGFALYALTLVSSFFGTEKAYRKICAGVTEGGVEGGQGGQGGQGKDFQTCF